MIAINMRATPEERKIETIGSGRASKKAEAAAEMDDDEPEPDPSCSSFACPEVTKTLETNMTSTTKN